MSKQTSNVMLSGKEYTLTAPDLADLQSLAKYCQYRTYHQLKEDAKTLPDLAALFPDALKQCAEKPVRVDEIGKYINEIDVSIQFIYLSLRHVHQSITTSDVATLVDPVSVMEITSKLNTLMGLKDDGGDSKNQ